MNKMSLTKTTKFLSAGGIEEKLEFSHQAMFERFYKTRVKVIRASGIEDVVPIIVSESLIGDKTTIVGKFVEIAGQLRTCNIRDKKERVISKYSYSLDG